MRLSPRIARIVRERRLRRAGTGSRARPLGRILLFAAGAMSAAIAAILVAPLPLPAPDLQMGSRPQGARFYDRTGKLLIQAGSARAGEALWYAAGEAPGTDCVLPAFLAARKTTLAEIRAPDLLGAPRAFADALAGISDPAGDAASELLAMHGSSAAGTLEKARLAAALTARYGKPDLVEWMINVRLYGNGSVGVDDAALAYFGLHAGALTAAQCAALETLAADPALKDDPAAWHNARVLLLNRMFTGGYLNKADWERAVADPVRTAFGQPAAGGTDPIFGGKLPILDSFLELAIDRLGNRFAKNELPRSGIRVFTTMDLDFELQLLCSAQNLLAPPADPAAALPTLEGKPCDMAALLGPVSGAGLPEDLALAVIDPEAGEVLAYFSSARGGDSSARGPAGTALLPFIYLSAFARGFSPASMLLDVPRADLAENPEREYRGPLSARTALQLRALGAAAGMAAGVGGDPLDRALSLLGLNGKDTTGLAFEDRLRQPVELSALTRAYATLAGGGLETADLGSGDAAVILRVERGDGTPLGEYAERQTRRVFGSDLAFLLQDILSDRSARADLAAPALAGSRSTVAAVLGEDLSAGSAWAFALAPGFAVGVRGRAYAADPADPQPEWLLAQAAAGWALRALPVQTWTEPPGIVRRDVCVPSGLLPSRYCPATASDIFLAGNEPSQVDAYYRPVAVNRETGRLATLWTPLNLIDERVFFVLDGEARVWAERSGFPIPPETYDTLPDSFPYFESLHLTTPSPLAVVRGSITVRGTAAEAGMERYLLRAGPGLYPSVWYTLGSGEKPVREDVLGVWDTAGADGIWSIQLTAVFAGGKILTVAIPVSLDNSPPAIRWIQPSAPQRITIGGGEPLILQAEVTDNLGLEKVEFYLDGKVRTRLEAGPFSVRWTGLAVGRHTSKICAMDRVGNETCTQEVEVEVGLKTSGGLLYNTPEEVET